ncbi:MAG: TOBE domain-containing protein [Nitrospiraceae bacterium]
MVLEQGRASGSARNHLTGTVQSVTMLGASARSSWIVASRLVATVTRSTVEEFKKLTQGLVITAAIKAGAVHLVSRQGD